MARSMSARSDMRYTPHGKLGSGARFKQLETSLTKKGAKNPAALSAWIGRQKYGKTKFQNLASKGK